MTGWRLGWLVMPAATDARHGQADRVQHLVRAACSRSARRSRRSAHATRSRRGLVAHLKACRDTLVPLLQALPGVEVAAAEGGMYAFFQLDGLRRFAGARQAPGGRGRPRPGARAAPSAPEAQGWLRWCFASQDPGRLRQGVDRLQPGCRAARIRGVPLRPPDRRVDARRSRHGAGRFHPASASRTAKPHVLPRSAAAPASRFSILKETQ